MHRSSSRPVECSMMGEFMNEIPRRFRLQRKNHKEEHIRSFAGLVYLGLTAGHSGGPLRVDEFTRDLLWEAPKAQPLRDSVLEESASDEKSEVQHEAPPGTDLISPEHRCRLGNFFVPLMFLRTTIPCSVSTLVTRSSSNRLPTTLQGNDTPPWMASIMLNSALFSYANFCLKYHVQKINVMVHQPGHTVRRDTATWRSRVSIERDPTFIAPRGHPACMSGCPRHDHGR